MITPKRFGLKYTPIPTLALEYECEAAEDENPETPFRLKVEADAGKAVSLYVYRNESNDLRCRKLHVVELPTLTRASEASKIIQQLQADNKQFLAPSIVKESQLRSLLERLIEHLQVPPADTKVSDARESSPASAASLLISRPLLSEGADHESEAEEEESMVEESAMEESVVSLEASKAEEDKNESVQKPTLSGQGTFLSQAEENEQEELPALEKPGDMEPPKPGSREDDETDLPKHEDDGHEQEKEKEEANHSEDEDGDRAKKAALKSDAEVSDEEDIQSEDLEYFSEDASDEDSF